MLKPSHILFLKDRESFLALLQKLLLLELSPNFFGSIMMIRDSSVIYYLPGDAESKRIKEFYRSAPPYGVIVGHIIRLIRQSPLRFTFLMKNYRTNLKIGNNSFFFKYLNIFDKR